MVDENRSISGHDLGFLDFIEGLTLKTFVTYLLKNKWSFLLVFISTIGLSFLFISISEKMWVSRSEIKVMNPDYKIFQQHLMPNTFKVNQDLFKEVEKIFYNPTYPRNLDSNESKFLGEISTSIDKYGIIDVKFVSSDLENITNDFTRILEEAKSSFELGYANSLKHDLDLKLHTLQNEIEDIHNKIEIERNNTINSLKEASSVARILKIQNVSSKVKSFSDEQDFSFLFLIGYKALDAKIEKIKKNKIVNPIEEQLKREHARILNLKSKVKKANILNIKTPPSAPILVKPSVSLIYIISILFSFMFTILGIVFKEYLVAENKS